MPGLYLVGLVVSLTGMVVLDARFRLFFWRAPRRAAAVFVVAMVFFLAWDVAGVGLGVFFIGPTSFLTGIVLAPQVPLEELFFLALLCYTTMDLVGFVGRAVDRAAERREARS